MRTIAIASIVLTCAVFTVSISAKGKTVKLVVSGGGLGQPIEIAGRDVLFANPWADGFVQSWSAAPAPAPTVRRYEVAFYEELPPRDVPAQAGEVRMMFVVEYAPGPKGGGVIHLPGHGDQRYRLNISTILRDGKDGSWFLASDEWERVVGSRLR